MATFIIQQDSTTESYSTYQIIVTYTVNTNSADTYKVTASCAIQAKRTGSSGWARCDYSANQAYFYVGLGSGSTNRMTAVFPTFSQKTLTTSWQTIATTSNIVYTVTKNHSIQTLGFGIYATSGYPSFVVHDETTGGGSLEATVPLNWSGNAKPTLSVSARTSYTISYNANSGSGAPSSQTKWYGENLALSSTIPTRSKYTFTKWNTVKGGTGTNYNAGAVYTANAAATLYAQWSYNHTAPKINTMVVKRCLQNGTDDDEGTYCKVEATYTIDTATESSAKIVSYTVKVGSYAAVTTNVSNGTASGSISYIYTANTVSTESPYSISLTVTDSIGFSTVKSSTLSPAFFTMDFAQGGHGIGIGKPANNEVNDLLDIAMKTRFNALATVQALTESSVAYNSVNPKIRFSNVDASQNGDLVFTDYDAVHTGATLVWITDQPQSWFHTQHIQATGSITSYGTVTAGQNENIKSTAVNDASVATSSNTAITSRIDYSGNGTQIGYSQIIRTSSGMYRSFAVTNPKASKTTAIYLHANDNGGQAISFTSGVAIAAENGGTGRAMTTANRTYWCGRIIYDNNTGTNGTVTLAETAANFAFMFIGFRNENSFYSGIFVRSPNGKSVALENSIGDTSAVGMRVGWCKISGTSLTRSSNGLIWVASNGTCGISNNNTHIYVTHVIGFA